MAALAITAESLLSGSSTSRVSYEHTWWQDATFNKPAAASLFSYIFRWQDDVVKVDFTRLRSIRHRWPANAAKYEGAAGELTSRNP